MLNKKIGFLNPRRSLLQITDSDMVFSLQSRIISRLLKLQGGNCDHGVSQPSPCILSGTLQTRGQFHRLVGVITVVTLVLILNLGLNSRIYVYVFDPKCPIHETNR